MTNYMVKKTTNVPEVFQGKEMMEAFKDSLGGLLDSFTPEEIKRLSIPQVKRDGRQFTYNDGDTYHKDIYFRRMGGKKMRAYFSDNKVCECRSHDCINPVGNLGLLPKANSCSECPHNYYQKEDGVNVKKCEIADYIYILPIFYDDTGQVTDYGPEVYVLKIPAASLKNEKKIIAKLAAPKNRDIGGPLAVTVAAHIEMKKGPTGDDYPEIIFETKPEIDHTITQYAAQKFIELKKAGFFEIENVQQFQEVEHEVNEVNDANHESVEGELYDE